jgi:hypothetical protein
VAAADDDPSRTARGISSLKTPTFTLQPFPLDQWHSQPTAGLLRVNQRRVDISQASGAITLIMGGWGDASIGVTAVLVVRAGLFADSPYGPGVGRTDCGARVRTLTMAWK